jgi:RNA recognition motif-containing protein
MFSGLKKELEKKKGVDSNLSFDGKRLYVTNIPFNSTETEIRAIFEKYGTVL